MSLRNCIVSAKDSSGGTYTDGVWTGQTDGTPYDVRCSIQPMSPNAMAALPEGRRDLKSYTLFTSVRLKTVRDDAPAVNPTIVTIRDEGEFEVYSQDRWGNSIIPNFETVVQKVQKTETPVIPEEP